MNKHNHQHADNHSHGNDDGIHSHKHEYDHHGHSHNHSHDHSHSHGHDLHGNDQQKISEKELGFEEKLLILFQHWIEHNDSHKDNYISWAKKAEHENLSDTAALLMDAAAASEVITEKLKKALKALEK